MFRRLLSIAALGLTVAACGDEEQAAEVAPAPRTPSIESRAVDGFTRVGGPVVDMALMPNALPFLGRGLAALEGGGFALLDFAEGLATPLDGPRVSFLAAAPEFQLRGAAAPLLIGAGGALGAPRAWVFLAEEGELVDLPMQPIETESVVRGMCADRATEALLELLIFTDAGQERWRVSDRGGDTLSAERMESVVTTRPIVACAGLGGPVAGVTDTGLTRVLGESEWGFADGSDVASVESSDGWWAIVARPDQSGASLIAPLGEEVEVDFIEGLNTPSTPAPTRLIASPANFGGSFSGGVLLLAQDDTINALDLTGVIADAKEALRDRAVADSRADRTEALDR